MNFTPKTEEELQLLALLPEGAYCYEVIKAEDKPNKTNGNIYTAITLKVWDGAGQEHLIFTNMALLKLIKHFCDVNNMQSEYQSGNIEPETFLHKSAGRVCIGIEGEKPNPNGGTYKAKNIVKDYIVAPSGSAMKPLPDAKDNFINDDLPF